MTEDDYLLKLSNELIQIELDTKFYSMDMTTYLQLDEIKCQYNWDTLMPLMKYKDFNAN